MMRAATIMTLLLMGATRVMAAGPSAGPMVGHVTDNSARLWMEFPVAGEVTINTYDVVRSVPVSGVRITLEGPSPYVCDVPINGLQANHNYRVEVKFDGEPVKLPGPEVVIRTAPAAGDEAVFSVAFGGGVDVSPTAAMEAHKIPALKSVTALKPRAFMFLGGTGNLPAKIEDFPTTHRAAYRFLADFHSAIRREPDLQELIRGTPTYGIFGERDFGPVGADGHYVFAQESLVAFQRFWPNPDWGTPANPGCFCNFSIGDVDFFMLDGRTFRQPSAAGGKLLGDAQLAWLKKNLRASKASFKVLAAPCTLWGDDARKPEAQGSATADSWSYFPEEQQEFLRWLGENKIDGVIGLAGGQPIGQLTRVEAKEGEALRYPLFSLGLPVLFSDRRAFAESVPDSHRVGQTLAGEGFGTLDFGGQREHRFVTLRLRDASGKMRVEQTLLAQNLRN